MTDSAMGYGKQGQGHPVLIPHHPTKLLIEPAACKSLKIHEVASRALASQLLTERGLFGDRAGKFAAAEATLATSLRFSRGEQAKKSQLMPNAGRKPRQQVRV